ncbi:hypothetical protein BN1723_003950 [Verticillium longisporum]|uniref:Uncharacterized protein n=1 Tax=Verticillium longisporum TaxID=100787 RepID=A0A0G4MGA5_VERLO|nr:hypothetical protein BN1723_003950 [Verticillium longisporum]
MKGRAVDQLVFESMFSKSRAGDPPNFHAFLQRTLILEVRSEVHAFFGHLDTQEAKYPGLDYCNPVHRVRLSRWPWHRRLFRAFDSLRLTPNEIANLTKWEGTKWAKERYEKEQGITIRDTAADEFSEWIEPEDRPLASASRGRTAETEAASEDEDMDGEDTDEEMESEAKYPGLDYCNPVHRVRLSRWPWHRRLFRAFDSLRLTPNEIANLTKWEGTKWAKERYEKEQGITIRDTAADEFSEWVEPEDRPLAPASRGRTAETEAASEDEDMEGEDTDEEMESVGTALNERLRERVARREAGEHATVLDEEWEQWLKNAIESGELPFVTPQTMQSTNSTNTPIMPTTLFPPRMLSAARAGQWSDIPDFLHDMIQRSISVETTDREEPLMPPLTRAPRRGPTDERRHPGAPWLRPYSGLRLPVGDGVTQSSPDLNAPVAADPPGA